MPFLVDASASLEEYRGLNRLYRLKGMNSLMMDSMGMDSPDQSSPVPDYVNESEMSVRAIISTPAVDRVGDILLPSGCQLDDYRKNPCVYWNHGLDQNLTTPIGKSEDPNGNLDVQITDAAVVAKCWFARSDVAAAQIFQLICERVVRATSVRETPLKSRQIFRNGQAVTEVSLWNMEEWSAAGVGVNPEALMKSLDRGRLDNRPILPSIYKSLTALLPQQPATSIGGFVETDSKLKSEGTTMADDEKEKTPADETTQETSAQAAEPEPGGDSDTADHPLGKQIIDATHSGLKSLCKCLNSADTPVMENKELKPQLAGVNDALQSQMKALEGMHTEHYPDFKSMLKSDDMDSDDSGGDSSDDSDSTMKAFLAGVNNAQLQVVGIPFRLKSMLNDKNLTKAQKKSIGDIADHLTRLVSQSKSYKPKVVEVKTESVSKSIPAKPDDSIERQRIAAEMKAIQDQLKQKTSAV